ncbi:MAG: hypothetical protein KC635_20370 [Myxococcales bacterium]|nr:hypothetical protein [Myxococcales bacterium]MCB9733783.1 hypothetical protein [Deltaproteobacteria bacterium]
MSSLIRLLLVVTLATGALAGCGDPCAELEQKVCEPKLASQKRDFAPLCKLMQEQDRREHLTKQKCTDLSRHVFKR